MKLLLHRGCVIDREHADSIMEVFDLKKNCRVLATSLFDTPEDGYDYVVIDLSRYSKIRFRVVHFYTTRLGSSMCEKLRMEVMKKDTGAVEHYDIDLGFVNGVYEEDAEAYGKFLTQKFIASRGTASKVEMDVFKLTNQFRDLCQTSIDLSRSKV